MLIGAAIGGSVAARVEMTQMPQLVAMLHSFVGLAAVLVGISSYLDPDMQFTGVEKTIHQVEIFIGVFIGAITFTGSIVAFGKLQGTISGKPLLLPLRHVLNLDRAGRGAVARLRLRRRAGGRRRPGAAARDDAASRWRSACTSSPPSAAPTCRSSSPC